MGPGDQRPWRDPRGFHQDTSPQGRPQTSGSTQGIGPEKGRWQVVAAHRTAERWGSEAKRPRGKAPVEQSGPTGGNRGETLRSQPYTSTLVDCGARLVLARAAGLCLRNRMRELRTYGSRGGAGWVTTGFYPAAAAYYRQAVGTVVCVVQSRFRPELEGEGVHRGLGVFPQRQDQLCDHTTISGGLEYYGGIGPVTALIRCAGNSKLLFPVD